MAISLDLSGLDSTAPAASNGEPLRLALDTIDVDPNQPRKKIDPKAMEEFVASIKEQGILQPITVYANPEKPGRWIIDFGERRYRGALAAGLSEIPAYVTEKPHGDYAQVIENLQREELEPMEIALFIQRKKAQGDKNADIARKLGKDRSFVNNHLALIDAPEPIAAAIEAGRVGTAKTVYDLRTLYDKHPDQVSTWLAGAGEITRTTVAALSKSLKEPAGQTGDADPASGKSVGRVQQTQPGQGDGEGEGGKTNSAQAPAGGDGSQDGERGSVTSFPPGKVSSDPELLKKPLLLVEHDGRSAAVLLNRRPSDAGRLRIRYEDNGADADVLASECTIRLLSEQPK